MPKTSGFDLTGDKELIRAFKRMGNETKKGRTITNAGAAALKPMANEMRKNARKIGLETRGIPKNPKFKTKAYKMLKTVKSRASKGADAWVSTGVHNRYRREIAKLYWIEYGTSNGMKARPFFRPAYDKHKDTAGKIMEEKMWESLEKQWNKP